MCSEYYINNKERIDQYQKNYAIRNKERVSEYQREYHQKHPRIIVRKSPRKSPKFVPIKRKYKEPPKIIPIKEKRICVKKYKFIIKKISFDNNDCMLCFFY